MKPDDQAIVDAARGLNTPGERADYLAVCLPGFSSATVHRDDV